MNQYYLHLKLTKCEEYIRLPKPLPLPKGAEMGVTVCVGPHALYNLDDQDTVKIATYSPYPKHYVKIAKDKLIAGVLNSTLRSNGYHSRFKHDGQRFHALVEPDVVIMISPKLAKTMGLPTVLSGTIVGKGPRLATLQISSRWQSEYLRFFKMPPQKSTFRVKPGYYDSKKDLQEAFVRTGLVLRNDKIEESPSAPTGALQEIFVSPDTKKKLHTGARIHFLFLCSDLVEDDNVSGTPIPLLRVLNSQVQAVKYRSVHYKKLRPRSELDTIHLKVLTDGGFRFSFQGTISLTLHIRPHGLR